MGACIQDIKKRLLDLTKPENDCLLLLIQAGAQEAETRELQNTKRLNVPWKNTEGIRSTSSVHLDPLSH